MAKTVVQIRLDRPEGPYYPGDLVQATITLQNEKELVVRGANAWLLMREEYKYSRPGGKGHTETHSDTEESAYAPTYLVGEGAIPAGTHTYAASLPIPADAAAPYAGKITKNTWLVKCKFDCPKAFDPEAEAQVRLTVPAPGRRIEPAEVGEVKNSEAAELSLWLPRLEWVEGETLAGKLLVRPRENLHVTEVRLELIRTEHVPRGYGKTHSETEAKAKVADDVDFWPTQPAEYPFALPVPKLGMPTRSTGQSTTSWTLQATLARRLRKDAEVSAEIEVYTGRR